MWQYVLGACALLAAVYAYLLSKRLDQSRFSREKLGLAMLTDEQLLQDSAKWREIDVLTDTNLSKATGKRYLITGCSGNLGVHAVQLLHSRGERAIYCLDISPLPPDVASLQGVHFRKCNITDASAVQAVFQEAQPDVVIHLCASIRFWERRAFTYRSSAIVNIDGTSNIIRALQELSDTSDKIMLHCSSAAVCLPEPMFMRLGWNWRKGYGATYTISDDREIPEGLLASHDYAQTKAVADKMVRQANGVKGIKTGVLRPGMSVCSPNDLFAGMMMRQPHNPTFVSSYAQSLINSQDLAACFLLYETAMRERPEEVAGDAFLVTGDRALYNNSELGHMIQLFAHRDLRYIPLHAFPLYVLAHLLELYCVIRYYTFWPWCKLVLGRRPTPHPKWMEGLRLHQIQPAMWNTAGMDVDVDDTRCRKVLGYRNKFSTPQTIRWIVDTIEASSKTQDTLIAEAESKASGEALPSLSGLTEALKKEKDVPVGKRML